jgi:hypothetical protein
LVSGKYKLLSRILVSEREVRDNYKDEPCVITPILRTMRSSGKNHARLSSDQRFLLVTHSRATYFAFICVVGFLHSFSRPHMTRGSRDDSSIIPSQSRLEWQWHKEPTHCPSLELTRGQVAVLRAQAQGRVGRSSQAGPLAAKPRGGWGQSSLAHTAWPIPALCIFDG